MALHSAALSASLLAMALSGLSVINPASVSAQAVSPRRALLGERQAAATHIVLNNKSHQQAASEPRHVTGVQALLGRSTEVGVQIARPVASTAAASGTSRRFDGERALLGTAKRREAMREGKN